jgi:type VI secretion system protein ImpE
MSARELYQAGRLNEAIEAQIQEVKKNPADQGKRLFLFELLAFAGDLDRTRRQIDAVRYDKMEIDAAVMVYRQLLDAEQARRRTFAEGVAPRFLITPPDHVRLRLEAVNCLRSGDQAGAAAALEKAAEARLPVQGTLNDKPFTSLRDADDLLAGVLEVMAQGVYFWVPLEQIENLEVAAPKTPRDLLWRSAELTSRDGQAGGVFLPTLYPGSHQHADDRVRLGRMTDWKAEPNGPVLGAGQHLLLAGEDEVGLLELRQLQVVSGSPS